MPCYRLGDKAPVLGHNVWLADNATVIGDVHLGDNVSLWWNTVLRGDRDPISIGANTNIQDGSVLHADEGVPLSIGAYVGWFIGVAMAGPGEPLDAALARADDALYRAKRDGRNQVQVGLQAA